MEGWYFAVARIVGCSRPWIAAKQQAWSPLGRQCVIHQIPKLADFCFLLFDCLLQVEEIHLSFTVFMNSSNGRVWCAQLSTARLPLFDRPASSWGGC